MPYLAPKQFANADEHAPEPLIQGEGCAGERLPSELHDDDLRKTNKSGMSAKHVEL